MFRRDTNGRPDSVELYALLDRAAQRLDQTWMESQRLRDPDLWMRLAEASHSLHRALIVLRQGQGPVSDVLNAGAAIDRRVDQSHTHGRQES